MDPNATVRLTSAEREYKLRNNLDMPCDACRRVVVDQGVCDDGLAWVDTVCLAHGTRSAFAADWCEPVPAEESRHER